MREISKVSVRDGCHHLIRLMEESNEDTRYPKRLLTDASVLDLWLAVEDGEVFGALLAQTYAEDRCGGVENFIVDRKARRRGTGRELMLAAERHYRNAGMDGMRLTVSIDNQLAVPLYRSLGYRTVRRYKRPADGRERLRMKKHFKDNA